MGDIINTYKIFSGKSEGRNLGKPKCRYDDKTRMDLQEIALKRMDWIHLA
jgi:hypothetical protein